MKKKFFKKLNLNKKLVERLNDNEQSNIKGGTDLACECQTREKDSCSVIMICCIPPERQENNG